VVAWHPSSPSVAAGLPREAVGNRSPPVLGTLRRMQTRYLLLASLVTALAIIGASVAWFLMAG